MKKLFFSKLMPRPIVKRYLKKEKQAFIKSRFSNSNVFGLEKYPIAHLEHLKVDDYSYGPINFFYYGDNSELKIGKFCSIAHNVNFILGGIHPLKTLSTFAICPYIVKEYNSSFVQDCSIVVNDDVWIATGATILGGVTIGQGAVVAAGSVVTNDVEPYSVVAGSPAKIIKYRFDRDVINELLTFADYSKINTDKIKQYSDFIIKCELNKETIHEFKKFFEP